MALPALDRRIVVRRTTHDRNSAGEPVEQTTDFETWATRIDLSQSDKEEVGGVLDISARAYVVRYQAEVANAPTSELSVIDGPDTLSANNVIEATERGERRRFLRIEVTGEATQ